MSRAAAQRLPSHESGLSPAREMRPYDFEICFFPIGENFVRLRGGQGIYQTMRQLTFRCGLCGQPVQESEMDRHANAHEFEARR